MAFYVVASRPGEFNDWLARQKQPAREPRTAMARKGAKRFVGSGCIMCHSVRGHDAHGQVGPDLTHLGSRMTIGAGLMKNTQSNLAVWITSNHRLKPGSKMPEYQHLDPEALQAITTYLKGLK